MGRIVFMHRLLLTIIICSLLVSLFFVFRSIYVMSLVMAGKKDNAYKNNICKIIICICKNKARICAINELTLLMKNNYSINKKQTI